MGLFAGTPFDVPAHCDECGKLESECKCPPPPIPITPPEKQTVALRLEKRKRGKQVTLISGILNEGEQLALLVTELKSICGAGGSIKNEILEIQGDHVETIRKTLAERGFRVKG